MKESYTFDSRRIAEEKEIRNRSKVVDAARVHAGPGRPTERAVGASSREKTEQRPPAPLGNTASLAASRRAKFQTKASSNSSLSYVNLSPAIFDSNDDATRDKGESSILYSHAAMVRLINSTARSANLKAKIQQSEQQQVTPRSVGSVFRGIHHTVVKAAKSVVKATTAIKTMVESVPYHEVEYEVDEEDEAEDAWMALFSEIKHVGEESGKMWNGVRWRAGLIRHNQALQKGKIRKTVFLARGSSKSFTPSKFYQKSQTLIGIDRVMHVNSFRDSIEETEEDDSTLADGSSGRTSVRQSLTQSRTGRSIPDSVDPGNTEADDEESSDHVAPLQSRYQPSSHHFLDAGSEARRSSGFAAALKAIAKIKRRARSTMHYHDNDDKRLSDFLLGSMGHDEKSQKKSLALDTPDTGLVLDSWSSHDTAVPSGRLSPGYNEEQKLVNKEQRERAARMAARERSELKTAQGTHGARVARAKPRYFHSPHAERRLGICEFKGPSLLAPEALEPDDHEFLRPLSPDEHETYTPEDFPEEILCEAVTLLSRADIERMFSELQATAGAKCPENGLALLEHLFLGPTAARPELWPLQWTICQWVLLDLHSKMMHQVRDKNGLLSTDHSDATHAVFRQRLIEVQMLLKRHQDRAPPHVLDAMVKNHPAKNVGSSKPYQEMSTDLAGQNQCNHCFFPYAAQRTRVLKLKNLPVPIWQTSKALRTHELHSV